jgi:hypothetical protein
MALSVATVALVLLAAAPGAEPVKPAFAEDEVLTRLESALPKGWRLTREKERIVIEGDKPLWVLLFNRINAPATWGEDAKRQWEKVRATTPAIRAHFVFRYEPRWSAGRVAQVRAQNQAVRDRHPPPSRTSAGPSKADWASERSWDAELTGKLQPLPYDTGRYSLFLVERQGIEDELTVVFPEEAGRDALAAWESVRRILEPHQLR